MAYTFTVNDMTCSGCAATVRAAVKRVPGVEDVQIDVPSRTVVVAAGQDVRAETVVAAITAAGYTEIAAGAETSQRVTK
jgi:copper chaperone CopZ